MATIGTFTKKDETYQGAITTLTLKAKVNITPVARDNDKAPDFRVYAGSAELGTTSPTVSLDLSQKTDAVSLPVGTTGTRPIGVNGMIRYNSTLPGMEALYQWCLVNLAG